MEGFCPLASGSKGNCLYLGSTSTRILIDAGLSLAQIEQKLAEIQVPYETIQAVLVTHEHMDHIRGLAQIAAEWNIPILTNALTAKAIVSILRARPRFKIFAVGERFLFGDLDILPFTIPHDAQDPVGFIIQAMGQKIGVCADLGYVTSLVQKMLEECHYLYLESNHQPSMVHASSRSAIYKQRVLSKQGHLSNEECATLLRSLKHNALKRVYLAHISGECNSHALALEIAKQALDTFGYPISLEIAHQDQVSVATPFEAIF